MRHLKENLKQDEIIIHEDFSENFQLKHQREVMEAHWSHELVTVFTAVVYYKDASSNLQHISYAVVSDELCHDKATIHMCNQALIAAARKPCLKTSWTGCFFKFASTNKITFTCDQQGI